MSKNDGHNPKLCVDAMGKTFEFPQETIDWDAVKQCLVTGMKKAVGSGRTESILLRHFCRSCKENNPILAIETSRELFEEVAKVTEGDEGYDDAMNKLIELVAAEAVKITKRYYNPPTLIISMLIPAKPKRGLGELFDFLN